MFCTEPVDEFCLQSLAVNKYKSFDLIDVNKADLKLPMFKKESESDSFEKKKIEYERYNFNILKLMFMLFNIIKFKLIV